jgi:hypothetical protein
MTTENPKLSVWNQAEELVGIYPSPDGLRNAIHAVITKSIDIDANLGGIYRTIGSSTIMDNVEYLAREYEARRGNEQFTHPMA